MVDIRPILFVTGLLLLAIGAAMLLPALIDLYYDNPDWQVFLTSAIMTTFLGGAFSIAFRGLSEALNLRQAFLMVTTIWIILPAFAAVPFTLSELKLSWPDAYFEAMSGLTTTGSTVITGLDGAPPGVLLWRALLQWLGGVGIVVMALAVLPMLQVGGMQLFRMESSDSSEKILPRAAQITGATTLIYLVFSVLCAVAYMLAGMPAFDAVLHMMTTIATGGFSTHDGSIGHFDSVAIESISILFMVIGSLPFLLYLRAVRGRPEALWRDGQVRWFFITLGCLIGGTSLWLMTEKAMAGGEALRYASFNLVSIMTGTGYASTDYGQWGAFAHTLFFLVMFIGGCAGSTSCGIKIFRFQVLFNLLGAWIKRQNQPHAIFVARYNNRPITDDVANSVISYLFLFLLSFIALSLALAAVGLDFITAFSGAATALANVGPGLGANIGPAGTFTDLPAAAKWLLSLGMLLGRLELFTVLVLLTPGFWKG